MTAQNKDSKVNFPYIDEMLAQLDINDPGYVDSFSHNIHFGFWRHPTAGVLAASLSEYKNAMEALTDEASRMAEIRSSSQIIDIGCGFGGAIHHLNQSLENAALVGLNIDPRQVDVAKRLCGKGIRGNQVSFIVADAQNTKLGSNSFDAAFAIESIFHMPHRKQFLREAFRILKPGGSVVITEVVIEPRKIPQMLLGLLLHLSAVTRYTLNAGTLGPPGTISSYKRLAKKVGFDMCAVEDWSVNVTPTFASLKVIKRHEANSPTSLYSPHLLDFAASMMKKGAHKYLAVRLRKPERTPDDRP